MIGCDNDDCKYEWFHWVVLVLHHHLKMMKSGIVRLCSQNGKERKRERIK